MSYSSASPLSSGKLAPPPPRKTGRLHDFAHEQLASKCRAACLSLALRAYPAEFRARYADEIATVFSQGLKTRAAWAWRRCALSVSGVDGYSLERRSRATRGGSWSNFGCLLRGRAGGAYATYVDFHATEVQPTLLVFVASGFVLGCLMPRRAWRRALVLAALLPVSQVIAFALRHDATAHGHPYLSRLWCFFPLSLPR